MPDVQSAENEISGHCCSSHHAIVPFARAKCRAQLSSSIDLLPRSWEDPDLLLLSYFAAIGIASTDFEPTARDTS